MKIFRAICAIILGIGYLVLVNYCSPLLDLFLGTLLIITGLAVLNIGFLLLYNPFYPSTEKEKELIDHLIEL